MDLSTLAVPPTMAALRAVLPAPPARVAEIGCGRGALAAALVRRGYDVTGIDRDADMIAATRARGVPAILTDVIDVVDRTFDVALFTRSLHHASDLDDVLRHTRTLLAPGGSIVIEEFAWERVDRAAAGFLYAHRRRLAASNLLDADSPAPELELDAWIAGHSRLHRGADMLAALGRVGTGPTRTDTSMLWRLVDGRGGTWKDPGDQAATALLAMREEEEQLIASGDLTAVGLIGAVRI